MRSGLQFERRRRLSQSVSRWLIYHPFTGSVRIQNAIGKLALPHATGPTLARTIYGFDLRVDPTFDRGLEAALYYRGTYEPGTLWVMENCLRAGDCFFDVGSNIGLMAVFAARRVGPGGRVHAFEPDGDTMELLQENLRINALSNVTPIPVALGSAPATLTLHRAHGNRGRSTLVESETAGPGLSVPVRTLDDLLTREIQDRPRMIKIDVEGWELPVLQGAQGLLTSSDPPILCVEYSRRVAHNGKLLIDLYAHLCSLNHYQIFRLTDGKERISRLRQISSAYDLPYEDNLFCFTANHLTELPRILFS